MLGSQTEQGEEDEFQNSIGEGSIETQPPLSRRTSPCTGAEIALVAFSTGGQSKTRSKEKRERSRAMKVWRPACLEEQVSVLALLWRCFPRAQQAAKGVRAQTICGNRLLSAMRFTSAMVQSTFVESLFLM